MSDLWRRHFKQEANTDGAGAGGGTGTGDLLGGTGGGSPAEKGGQGTGSAPATGGTPAENGGNPPGGQGGAAPDWRSSLPAELRENSNLQRFKDTSDLAAGYVNLQRQFSSGKLAIPGNNATDEDWQQVFEKLGVPKEVKDYSVKFKDGVSIEPEFVEDFKKTAHQAGILPKQAQKLADWFAEKNMGAEQTYKQMIQANFEKELTGLKTEWGQAFEAKLGKANALFSQAPPELQAYFKENGLARNIGVVKFMATMADKFMGENAVIEPGASGKPGPLSPTEAKAKSSQIMGDMSHPYHQKEHPGHKAAVAEMQQLFSAMHPTT